MEADESTKSIQSALMVVVGGRDGSITWFSHHDASSSRGRAAPKLILYPNAHLQQVCKEVAARDIDECCAMAKGVDVTASQGKSGQVVGSTAVGGAIGSAAGAVDGTVVDHPGRGAMVGAASGVTAGFLRELFRRSLPSNAHKQFV